MTIITRFAPSPTGMLHVGNARTALINYLYTKANSGKFILRIDDTDIQRNKKEYEDAIKEDLEWLGFSWDDIKHQSSRLAIYEEVKKRLIASGRLYPCYETADELETKRKLQLSSGRPPIYDRAALKLTDEQKAKFVEQGRQPHYRFKLAGGEIKWQDLVRGEVSFQAENLSDPVLIRADGSMTYMLCSTVDDIEFKISHVIRGEDHVTNTAIQIQLFASLDATPPTFGHLALIKSKDEKISKREGGFSVRELKEKGILPISIVNFFATIGTSGPVTAHHDFAEVVKNFDISTFSRNSATYLPEELERLNQKILSEMTYAEISPLLQTCAITGLDEEFWLAVRNNIKNLNELKDWLNICRHPIKANIDDKSYIQSAAKLLPGGEINDDTWGAWTSAIANETGRKGKNLFMPLRLALTGMEHGPELKKLLPIIGRHEIVRRLSEVS